MAQFDHEKLDVYQVSLQFIGWTEPMLGKLTGHHRHVRDQLCRAALSISLNIAEGCGKRPGAERCRFYEIARGSTMECAACLDAMVAAGVMSRDAITEGKELLVRIVAMLIRMAPPNAN